MTYWYKLITKFAIATGSIPGEGIKVPNRYTIHAPSVPTCLLALDRVQQIATRMHARFGGEREIADRPVRTGDDLAGPAQERESEVEVVEDLVANREVNVTSRYESQQRNNVVGDFRFVVMEKFLSQDNELPFFERVVMKLYFWLKEISLSEEKGFGLEQNTVQVEKFPLIIAPVSKLKLKRIYTDEEE